MTPRTRYTLALPGGRALELGARTLVMGIVNVTPDSFAGDGVTADPGRAAERALALEEAGADLVDVGGESTRPGAEPVPADEELRRILPVLDRLRGRVGVPVSVDTYKAEVARAALDHGADLINDVSGLAAGPGLAAVAADAGAPLVLMHNRGASREMYRRARYRDVGSEVAAELRAAVDRAVAAGVTQQLPVDDKHNYSRDYLNDQIAILLGGRLAEELTNGNVTTGAGNDLDRATDMARRMVCEWGMSESIGPLTYGKKEEQVFLGRDFAQSQDYSEGTAIRIDQEIKRIVTENYDRARELLGSHKDELVRIAEELLIREVLDAEQVKRLARGLPIDPAPDPASGSAPPTGTVSPSADEPEPAPIVPPPPVPSEA